jgi:hypothetical protein
MTERPNPDEPDDNEYYWDEDQETWLILDYD